MRPCGRWNERQSHKGRGESPQPSTEDRRRKFDFMRTPKPDRVGGPLGRAARPAGMWIAAGPVACRWRRSVQPGGAPRVRARDGRMAQDRAMEIDASEIRYRAERRLGELISEHKANDEFGKGGRPPKTCRDGRQVLPTLRDVGISRDLSSRAQKLAAVPEVEFEQRDPQQADRVIARKAKVGTRAVAQARADLGDVATSPTRIGADGVAQPAKRKYTRRFTERSTR